MLLSSVVLLSDRDFLQELREVGERPVAAMEELL